MDPKGKLRKPIINLTKDIKKTGFLFLYTDVVVQPLQSNGVRGLTDIYRLFKYLSGINYSHSSFGTVLLHRAKLCLLVQA